jgi:hypothetical protein
MNLRVIAAIALLVIATALGAGLGPAAAQDGGDLNCGDPGTSHNMPVDPNNDPNNLDANNDGIGCEDASVFGGAGGVTSPSGQTTPAAPVEAQPTFTG